MNENIRDKDKYFQNIWDFNWLNDCFSPTKIRPTDIDEEISVIVIRRNTNDQPPMEVERKGYHLRIETKLPGNEVTQGQAIVFDDLLRKGFQILIIWGHPGKPESAQLWGKSEKKAATKESIAEWVTKWFQSVNRG